MFPKTFYRFASLFLAITLSVAGFHPVLAAPPLNDNFADAEAILSLPFTMTVDITEATTEADEPQWCTFMAQTVWYSFIPAETMLVQVGTQGSFINANINIYQAIGPGITDLDFKTCIGPYEPELLILEAGTTYFLQAGPTYDEVGIVQINLERVPPPPWDNFANAFPISTLPTAIDFQIAGATTESGEPIPTCISGSTVYSTIWFTFTPTENNMVTASVINSDYSPYLVIYSGSSLNNLTELGCVYYGKRSFAASAGQTYYIQLAIPFGQSSFGTFLLEVTPPPQANFYFFPGDPSKYDTVQFDDQSYDPAEIGISTEFWDFGDGSTSSGSDPVHKFISDGDYPVTLTVTTQDGRTGSHTRTVQVRTHDVSITKVAAPNSANAGQTKSITVAIRNMNYPETVTVDLYKSIPGGETWIGSLTLEVPVLSGSKTKLFAFDYTFTSQDAQIGKVTFRAVAALNGVRDAFPEDNTGISSPPTKVIR